MQTTGAAHHVGRAGALGPPHPARLELHFQPIVDLATREMVAAEALVRWRHPELGLLPPRAFLPQAERSGLIVRLGAWVLTEACRQAARWPMASDGTALGVAVNMSARQLAQRDLTDVVASALDDAGLSPARLTLEVTESNLVEDPQAVDLSLWNLRLMGVRVALDRFGTGHASFGQLQRLTIDELKIDRSFIRPLARRPDDAVAKALISLGVDLGLQVVAEGVESPEVVPALEAMGCHRAQGHLWSRPVPADHLLDLILEEAETPIHAVG